MKTTRLARKRLPSAPLHCLFLLAGVLLGLWGGRLGAQESTRIAAITWLPSAPPEKPQDDQALVRLVTQEGIALQSMDEVPYIPFKPEWLVVRLQRTNPSKEPEFFRFTSMQRREVDTFLVVQDRIVAHASAGYARTRPADAFLHPDLNLPLAAWSGSEATVLVRCVSTERLPFRAAIVDSEQIHAKTVSRAAFLLFLTGCNLIFIAMQFLLYRSLREEASRDFIFFVGTSLLVHLIRPGYLSWDLCPGSPGFYPGDLTVLLKLMSLGLALRTLASYLNLAEWAPKVNRVNQAIQLGLVAGIPVTLSIGAGAFQTFVSCSFGPVCLWTFIVAICAIRARRLGAGILIVAWALLTSSAVYVNLAILGVVRAGPYLEFIAPMALLCGMLLNGFGLMQKLALLQAEKLQAAIHRVEVKGLTRLVRVVCHDIASPLLVIRLSLHGLKTRLAAGAPATELSAPVCHAEMAEEAIKAIIEDVRQLELLRSRNGKLPLEPVNVADVAKGAIRTASPQAEAKGIRLLDKLPEEAHAYAAPGILERNVIANVMTNAIKFSPGGSSITLAIKASSNQIGLQITDEGPGMPRQTVDALERGESMVSRLGTAGEPGTGFGLQIAQDFTVAMGGRLQFEAASPNAGGGTTVTIWLKSV